MSDKRKVVLIIMDSLGVGALPDADKYGDQNADTFGHIVRECGSVNMPNLLSLGWGNIDGVCEGKLAVEAPAGCFGKMAEVSAGKDTTTGHWEIAGLKTDVPFKTYPDGFPKEFMDAFAAEIGTECIGNYPASGTAIIEELGPEHEATGKPIVYTSADSVLQIAANIDVIPLERLYEICKIARRLLVGEWACGRVIARPYKLMEDGSRKRTLDRHDYSVTPPEDTLLDMISGAGLEMYSVGKLRDIFTGKGVTTSAPTKGNMDGVNKTLEAMAKDFKGCIFSNLVDFDSDYGHRRDPIGYGRCIEEFDARLPEIMAALCEDDVLIITADHGNDPVEEGTDHTREYVPLIVYGKKCKAGVNLGIRSTFADVGATVADLLDAPYTAMGTSFKDEIL